MIALLLGLLLIGSATLVTVGVMGLLGRLRPNNFVGIRVNFTMSSEERWYTTHRYAAMPLIFGGVATTSICLAFFPFAAAGRVSTNVGLGVILAVAAVMTFMCIVSAFVGLRAARAAEG